MNRNLLITVLVVLFIVIVVLIAKARPVVVKVVGIQYSAPGNGGPYLTFKLKGGNERLAKSGKNMAILRNFTPDADQGADAQALASILLQGLPFVPVWAAPDTVTSNTIPIGAPTTTVTMSGMGEMSFQ